MLELHAPLRSTITTRLKAKRRRPRLAALFFLAAFAATGSQVACNNSSPTAPALPPSPPPQPQPSPVIDWLNYTLLIAPVNENRAYPLSGELQIDGRTVWAGDFPQPQSFYYGYVGGYSETPFNVIVRDDGDVPVGTHRITLRVTGQYRSPSNYLVSGWVDVVWTRNGGVRRVASWQDETVRLRTGEEWSSEFVVPELTTP